MSMMNLNPDARSRGHGGATRQPAVAGSFYPASPAELRALVERLLAAPREPRPPLAPKALIAPHAGYIYSGPIAASAYATLAPLAARIRRVVLLGPSHFVPFRGLAWPGVEAFRTPLGTVELDAQAFEAVRDQPGVITLAEAHAREHSLEVQLPFLQVALGEFRLVPLAVGYADPTSVAGVLDALWGGPETLVVVSSDLSHYRSYEAAAVIDAETARAIEQLDERPLDGEHACGCHPIAGLLHLARKKKLRVAPLDRRSSGDTAGDKRRVVGYGSWAFG
jgi:AmmeMemoRadiSam system protein B